MKRATTTILALLLLCGVSSSDSKLTERERALHVLNRLAFGARPGDVDRLLREGVDVWIERQLHPEGIADRAVDARVAQLATWKMSDSEIVRTFYLPVVQIREEKKKLAAAKGDDKMSPDGGEEELRAMRRAIPPEKRPQRLTEELADQRLLRAVDSERQLNEVMVDFWMNHFNVYSGKALDRFLLTSYERDTIRPHIWGRFEDLLMATAKSPAMLFYLDNAQSVADPEQRASQQRTAMRPAFGRRDRFGVMGRRRELPLQQTMAPAPAQKRRGGLNENYAREIMELHTLGVDAGYTQKDVTELARVFTGWSIARPQEGSGFIFRANLHDRGAKTVLGIHFPAGGGIEEGERMIHVLSHHPATAHHIAYELCQRLVADEPPPALVDRVARRFVDSDGDLRETVKAVIASPEFQDPKFYRAKVKSPLEYVASAVRAVGGRVDDPASLVRSLAQMGEPLYGAQPPTGYSDKADVWVNTGALLGRLNFALALAANKMPGVHSEVLAMIPAEAAADARRSVDALAVALTGGNLSEETRATIKSRIVESLHQDPWDNTQIPTITGLILGSPEFQRQ